MSEKSVEPTATEAPKATKAAGSSTDAPKAATAPEAPTAREVAAALDRRQRRRRIFLLLLLAAAIALAVVYGTCGKGWGLGAGKGDGKGSGPGSVQPIAVLLPDGPPARCVIRVAGGDVPYSIDERASTPDEIVAKCAAGVDVTVTGDAREGDWTTLRDALTKAGIAISVREPKPPR